MLEAGDRQRARNTCSSEAPRYPRFQYLYQPTEAVSVCITAIECRMYRIQVGLASFLFILGSYSGIFPSLASSQGADGPQMAAGMLSEVGDSWITVSLPFVYQEMVVVATPVYGAEDLPAVARIRNATGNQFELRVQNPSDESLEGYGVHYLVVEAGVYDAQTHGITMEAGKIVSSVTAYPANWVAEETAMQNEYDIPVVLGQVMTFDNERWSVFWSHGDVFSNPPLNNSLYLGKHIGEDADRAREPETIGYVIFEAGFGEVEGRVIEAIAGEDIVRGPQNSPPFAYPHGIEGARYTVASQAAIDGGNGAWPFLWKEDSIGDSYVNLVADEDQTFDDERSHTTEQAHVLVISPDKRVPQLVSIDPLMGIEGTEVEIQGAHLWKTLSVFVDETPAEFTAISDSILQVVVPPSASTGFIRIQTPAGEVQSNEVFTLVNRPQIRSFDPPEGPRGAQVQIVGQNFVEVRDVTFNGWSSPSFTVLNDTTIVASVPDQASTGRIRVRNIAGQATTSEVFEVLEQSAVSGIDPYRSEVSSTVRLTGFGFSEAVDVLFAGDVNATYTVISDNELEAVVPAGSSSGPVRIVTANNDTLTSTVDFILTFAEADAGVNLCRLTTASASQSSLALPSAIADKACDGIAQSSSGQIVFSATQAESEAWWETDLGDLYDILEVAIWNRSDCCQSALSNFFMFVSDEPFISTAVAPVLSDPAVMVYLVDQVEDVERITVRRPGRYVRLQHIGIGELNLGEVEIFIDDGIQTHVDEEDRRESSTRLLPAYPSPFRERTTLAFALEKAEHVRLSVFDALGREVAVLVDQHKTRGSHTVSFDAGHLSNGVYFYRLEAGSLVETKAMMLAR